MREQTRSRGEKREVRENGDKKEKGNEFLLINALYLYISDSERCAATAEERNTIRGESTGNGAAAPLPHTTSKLGFY